MKKTFIVLGAIVSSLLMVSTATALTNTYSEIIKENNFLFKDAEVNIENVKKRFFTKDISPFFIGVALLLLLWFVYIFRS